MIDPTSPSTSPPGMPAIEMAGVVKSFGDVTALAGIDLTVAAGTVTALLGPNGAGKTTLVRIVATLTRPDRGRVRVLGLDALSQPAALRARIGLTGQYAGLDEGLTGLDNLILIGRLAGLRRRPARERAAGLATRFGLTAAIGRRVRTYSGGMRRRLDLAASLMTQPELLVLDEPTTGLDPASRRELWDTLIRLRASGTTLLLTTQYLAEADAFADIAHVLGNGRLIASGTPADLKARAGGSVVEARLEQPSATPAAAGVLARRLSLPAGAVQAGSPGVLTVLTGDGSGLSGGDGAGAVLRVAGALRAEGFALAGLALRQPSLDEAFLALTGRDGVPA